MSVQTNVVVKSRNIRVVFDVNNAIEITAQSSDDSFETVLNAALEKLGREVDISSLLAVNSGGAVRVNDRNAPIGDTESIVVDRPRTNG